MNMCLSGVTEPPKKASRLFPHTIFPASGFRTPAPDMTLRLYNQPIESAHHMYHISHLRQQCHNSKFVIFQEKLLKVLKCYNFLWVQRRHNCSPAASFSNCVTTLYLLKVHLQTFISIPITQKCQILSCVVANERYIPLPSVRMLHNWMPR
jgi:hypothetical protein